MAHITRFIVRYKQPYSSPAKYTSCTKFIFEDDDGEIYEFLCGNKYRSYRQFIKTITERHKEKNIKIDRTKPYVIYQS